MRGLPPCSLYTAVATSGTNRISMAANTAQPWRGIAHQPAEGIRQRRRNEQDGEHLQKVREAAWGSRTGVRSWR